MRQQVAAAVSVAFIFASGGAHSTEHAASALSLDTYHCREFVADSTRPDDAQKLIRTLMMVSWAAGFSAAYERNGPRSDEKTLRLVTATLKSFCFAHPDELVVLGFVESLREHAAR